MERESFEDPDIGKILSEHFVAIKVREYSQMKKTSHNTLKIHNIKLLHRNTVAGIYMYVRRPSFNCREKL